MYWSVLLHRGRIALMGLALGAGVMSMATAPVFADDAPAAEVAVADPAGTGPVYTTPTDSTVPGYSSAKTADAKADALAAAITHNYYSINFVWTLVAGFLVMFMQAGFALVETGLCRAKNAAHVMSMNFMVYALGMTGFFISGYALMCGGAGKAGAATLGGMGTLNHMVSVSVGGTAYGLFGLKGFFLTGGAYDAGAVAWFLFMMVFMDTTATIPTGALAERWKFSSFFIFSLFIGGLIYPVYGCWIWGGGWLSQLGAFDYAGSSVVHMQGGVLALITSWMLGPRIGKYDSNGKPKPILGHNIPMVFLGTFILAFGWFGFNAGSSMAGGDLRIGVIAVNTMLASASGALVAGLYMWMRFGKPDPSMMCNGMLAGLVAITAPCAYVNPIGGFIIGAIAGILVVWSVFFFEKIGIDDPVGAISVHGVNGMFGMLAVGIFSDGTYGGVTGFLFGEHSFHQFAMQALAVGACFAWNAIVGGLIFHAIGKTIGNRVAPEIEIAGLDLPEMGASGYPEYLTPISPEQVPASEVSEAKARLAMH